MKVKVVNHFWVGGDIVIALATGATQEVLRLVHSKVEASTFGRATAANVMSFVESRVNSRQGNNPVVKFTVEPSETPRGLWVIHGVQEVEIESES